MKCGVKFKVYSHRQAQEEQLKRIHQFKLAMTRNLPQKSNREIVNKYPHDIQYMSCPDKEVKLAAVTKDPLAIYHIKYPDFDIQMAAVMKNPHSIMHIDNPLEEVQMAAVMKNPHSIMHIDNPLEEVQLAAVRRSWRSFYYIDNPTDDVRAQLKYEMRYGLILKPIRAIRGFFNTLVNKIKKRRRK